MTKYANKQKENRETSFPNAKSDAPKTEWTRGGDEITLQNPGNIETRYKDTGKSLEGLSSEQLDWRNKEIERLGGTEAYHKKYGTKQQRTGEVTNTMYNMPKGMGEGEALGTDVFKYFKKNNDMAGMKKWMALHGLKRQKGKKNILTKTEWENVAP